MESLLLCLQAQTEEYGKNEMIYLAGNPFDFVGVVISGKVQVVREDYFGNKSIITEIGAGEIFGEAFACAERNEAGVSVYAAADCVVAKINYKKIITVCKKSCPFHNRLIFNMLQIMAQNNLRLQRKIEIISHKTTREKLLSYLTTEAERAKSGTFTIPFNRQQLAEYLNVDRSAMSKELCKMRDEGVLQFSKDRFTLRRTQ